jgi:hypothetical protein
MNTNTPACNYAMLRFLPYPETGEFVNVGVLVSCTQPCLLDFLMETEMPARVKALFPQVDENAFRDAAQAMQREMEWLKGMVRDGKSCQLAFRETVRPRESVLRFGEVKTILAPEPAALTADLFRRHVRMNSSAGAPLAGV